jgi:hypothetical protein
MQALDRLKKDKMELHSIPNVFLDMKEFFVRLVSQDFLNKIIPIPHVFLAKISPYFQNILIELIIIQYVSMNVVLFLKVQKQIQIVLIQLTFKFKE